MKNVYEPPRRPVVAARLNAALAYDESVRMAMAIAKAEFDWDLVDYLQECIDASRDELEAARAAMREFCN